MTEAIRLFTEYLLIAIALVGYYVTTVHLKWWKLYNPSPMIKHLLISSIAVDAAATIMAILAALLLLGIELPSGLALVMIALSLTISLSVKIYRRFDLRALDHPDEDLTPRVETTDQREDRQFGAKRRELEALHRREQGETQNQAEDRHFGNQRRELEVEHKHEETQNQRDDRLVGDAKRLTKDKKQDAINDANQE